MLGKLERKLPDWQKVVMMHIELVGRKIAVGCVDVERRCNGGWW